jgi:diguanylate cyclase (GGDEF)-like protein
MNILGRVIGGGFGLVNVLYWNVVQRIQFEIEDLAFLLFFSVTGWYLGYHYDKAKFLSEKDALTETYNRRFIAGIFPKLKLRLRRRNQMLAIFVIDVNDFKLINDSFGHARGDEILRFVSTRLKESIRQTDFLIRWGGDEFVIVAEIEDIESVSRILRRIEDTVSTIEINEMQITLSIGTSIYPIDSDDFNKLIEIADNKMYALKAKRK